MTETPSPQFKRWHKALLALGILTALGVLTFWFLTTATFWQQVGWRLVAELQNRVNGEVAVGKVSGNLVTGMIFSEVKISRPQGDIIRVKELEVSLSLLSLFRLQPVIRTLAFRQPEVFLVQDVAGNWNVANLLKKRPPPPFSHIHLSGLRIQDGSVQVDRAQQHLTFQDVNVQLNLTIQNPGRPHLTVRLHQGAVGFTSPPYPAVQANLALTYSAQEIDLTKIEISLAGSPVLSLAGKLANLPTEPEVALNLQMPELSGTQLQKFFPTWPAGVPWRAGLEVKGPLANLNLTGKGALQDCQWQVTGRWQQKALAEPKFHLGLNFQNLTGALLAAWQPRADLMDGLSPLSGALNLSGGGRSWPPGNLEARLDIQPFSNRQAKVETGTLTFKVNGERRQQATLKLSGNFGSLETEVSGQLWQLTGPRTASAGELKLTTSALNPALLLGGTAPSGSLDLKYTGDFQVPPDFNWSQVRLTGKMQASGKLKDYAFQELSAQGSWESGELRLNPARLVMSNLRAEAQGRLSADKADLKLALDLLPPGPWPLLPPEFKGQFRADGSLQGAWQSLSYQVNFQGKALSWRRLALESVQGKTAGTVSKETFVIAHFDILAQKFSTPVGLFGQIQGNGETRGSDLVFHLKAQQAPGQSGALAGVASWEKDTTRIRITQLQWGPPNFQVAAVEPVTVAIAPGRFEITPLRLRYQKTFLALSGKVTREDVALQVKLDNLQLGDIARLVPQVALLHGTINAQADISGSSQTPTMKGYLNVAPGQIGKFAFDSFQTNWLYQGNVLTLNGMMVEKPAKAKLTWQGTTPLTVSLLPWSWHLPESGLNLRVWSDNLNLSLFAALIRGVSASEGPMQLQAQITGSLRRPLLAGALRYGPGSVTIRESGAPLAIEPGEIRLEGDRLVVPHLLFRSGDGQGDITGGAKLEDFKLRDVHLNLTATNLLIIRREGSRAVASGQAALKGSWPNFQTEGRVTVNEGQFRLSFFRSEQNKEIVLLPRVCLIPAASAASEGGAAVERNFTVNLIIDIPGGVWLRDKDLNGELEGQIKVLRQPPGPKYLGGWVRAKPGGVFAINNKMFTVEKAALTFPGKPHKPILADVRASRQVDDYTLYVVASGPLDNPRTRLESNPPLSPRDQLSLLVFDHLADKMTREEYVTATQKAMGLVGSLTAQKLKSLFGEGLPFLGEVSPTTSQEALGVGKKLSKDITVSYERKLNPLQGEDVNQIRLDYKIHKHFSAESQLGRKNTGGDLFFNIDF